MKKILLIVTLFTFMFTLSGCSLGFSFEEVLVLLVTNGKDTVEINTEWNDAGAKFYVDNIGTNVVGAGRVDTTKLGLYEINYLYAFEGKTFSKTRFVIVVDQIAPIISLIPGIDTIKLGESWNDAGANVSDNSEEILQVVVNGSVDTSTVGLYKVIYSAEDSSGNSVNKTRYVNVIN